MGRPRSFDTDAVVASARDAFVRSGYVGTSIDDLLTATGLQRASLYSAFGSKRGLFVAVLRAAEGVDLDLLLVALMDASAGDGEVRSLVQEALERLDGDAERTLGERLLRRAGLGRHEEEGSRT